mgnify:CR=1 FL=1
MVLEVSCGSGINFNFIPENCTIFGLDLSFGMLQAASYRKNAGVLCHGLAEKLPFIDHAFDTVFHIGGINFFNDKAEALKEMVRVAKPGTKIIIKDETPK